jgi:hypothetical protein
VALAARLKRLDPLFEFLLHPRCCLVKLISFRDECVATHASGNGIGVEGATALASALERNSTLQHLDVGCECRCDARVCVVCAVCGVVNDDAM